MPGAPAGDVAAVGAAGDWDDGGVLRVLPVREDRGVDPIARTSAGVAGLCRGSLRGPGGANVCPAERRRSRGTSTATPRPSGRRRAGAARPRPGQPPGDGSVDPRARAPRHRAYAVKVHRSALEYTVEPQPERFLPAARGAGPRRDRPGRPRHTAESLSAAMDDPQLPARNRLGPPGVDVEDSGRGLAHGPPPSCTRSPPAWPSRAGWPPAGHGPVLSPSRPSPRSGEAARALARIDLDQDRVVVFVGKLIVSKGIDRWRPPGSSSSPRAGRQARCGRLGGYHAALERLLAALAAATSPTCEPGCRGPRR